jgi:hypothetical protein
LLGYIIAVGLPDLAAIGLLLTLVGLCGREYLAIDPVDATLQWMDGSAFADGDLVEVADGFAKFRLMFPEFLVDLIPQRFVDNGLVREPEDPAHSGNGRGVCVRLAGSLRGIFMATVNAG